jgi:hypothetical protein
MLGPLVGKMRQTQLPDPTQPLKLERVDQSDQQPPFFSVGFDPNYVVDRIAVNSFGQIILREVKCSRLHYLVSVSLNSPTRRPAVDPVEARIELWGRGAVCWKSERYFFVENPKI